MLLPPRTSLRSGLPQLRQDEEHTHPIEQSAITPAEMVLHSLQPKAMRGDEATGLKKQIPSSKRLGRLTYKTKPDIYEPRMRACLSICRDLLVALFAFSIALSWGCIASQKAERTSVESAFISESTVEAKPDFWYLQKAPSTYYPVGVPKDFTVTAATAEWLKAKNGTYLIPLNGAGGHTQSEAILQALAMRTDGEVAAAKSQEAARVAVAVMNPVNWLAAACAD